MRKRDGERDKEREREMVPITLGSRRSSKSVTSDPTSKCKRKIRISSLVAPPPCLLFIGTDPWQDGVIFSYNGKATPSVPIASHIIRLK